MQCPSGPARKAFRPGFAAAALGLAALLTGCRVRGIQAEQSPLLRLFERASGLISFVGADGNVYATDQKAGAPVALTTDAAQDTDLSVVYGLPTWSPDGRFVAFPGYRAERGASALTSWIGMADRRGKETRRLYTSTALRPIYLSWSPDSTRVSILSAVQGATDLELGVAPAERSDAYVALDSGAPYYWDWLPDNRTLAVHVSGERLSLLAADRSSRRVDLGVALAVFQAPDITTDGVTLAYVSLRGADVSLVLHRLATREERTLTTSSGPLYFSFSRDSSRIAVMRAVAAQPLPYGRLDVLETAAPAATQTLSEELGLAFFWSPDGSRIAYLVLSQDPNTTDPMFLLSGEALYVELRGFEPRTGKSWAITQYPLTRGLVQILPFFDQYLRSITPWSPDGRNLVFTAFANDGVPGVYVVPADGNIKPRYLTPGDSAYWSPK